jgi:hypothetical protein
METLPKRINKMKKYIIELFNMVHDGNNIDHKIRANEIYSDIFNKKT